jgi:hypothetical protein
VRLRPLSGFTLAAAFVAAALPGVGCGAPPVSGPPIKTVIIGPEGGQAGSVNGQLKIQIPAGGLDTSLAITVQQIDSPAPGAVMAYELGPSGTTFASPVSLLFHYKASDVGAGGPSALKVATFSAGAWQVVPSQVDDSIGMVSADITHFSPWSLVVIPGP